MRQWWKYIFLATVVSAIDGGCFAFLLREAGCNVMIVNIFVALKAAGMGAIVAAVCIARLENKRCFAELEAAMSEGEREHQRIMTQVNKMRFKHENHR